MNMKNILGRMRSRAGFTMIELLVVIAVIGVLAVAVLSSINPIEQINKGRDTRLRSNAAQLINAVDRFYAIQEIHPWNDATYVTALAGADSDPTLEFSDGNACAITTVGTTPFCTVGGAGYTTDEWVTALASTEEVKQSFVDQVSDTGTTNVLYIYKAADEDTYVCFSPASKQFQLEAIDGCIDRAATLPAGACQNGPYSGASVWVDEFICLP